MTRIVVAGAVIDRARLLVAQRSRPPELAGLWELPGGKVEPGESPQVALARELVEELGIEVTVGEAIGGRVQVAPGVDLLAWRCELRAGTPTATEHLAIRWVDPDELSSLAATGAVVPADTAWLPDLLALLDARDPQ
ncbi:(deoxy)nucleoside triphosphate pyrophosphohydrolase [Williamsia sp. MIQD14]|uniref:(deoxy)nucleoside triphosphate pyrophosphohydrolase n=1 Tax=Williamsia sp. MIQD14 TaxID=3425703 RepID=UPI003D9FF29A